MEQHSSSETPQHVISSASKSAETLSQVLQAMKLHSKNRSLVKEKKEAIKAAGKDACYLLADFDRTLTYGT